MLYINETGAMHIDDRPAPSRVFSAEFHKPTPKVDYEMMGLKAEAAAIAAEIERFESEFNPFKDAELWDEYETLLHDQASVACKIRERKRDKETAAQVAEIDEICEFVELAEEAAMSELAAFGDYGYFAECVPETVAEFGACWHHDAELAELIWYGDDGCRNGIKYRRDYQFAW